MSFQISSYFIGGRFSSHLEKTEVTSQEDIVDVLETLGGREMGEPVELVGDHLVEIDAVGGLLVDGQVLEKRAAQRKVLRGLCDQTLIGRACERRVEPEVRQAGAHYHVHELALQTRVDLDELEQELLHVRAYLARDRPG